MAELKEVSVSEQRKCDLCERVLPYQLKVFRIDGVWVKVCRRCRNNLRKIGVRV